MRVSRLAYFSKFAISQGMSIYENRPTGDTHVVGRDSHLDDKVNQNLNFNIENYLYSNSCLVFSLSRFFVFSLFLRLFQLLPTLTLVNRKIAW